MTSYLYTTIYLTKFPTLPVTFSWIIQNHVLVIQFSSLNDLCASIRVQSPLSYRTPLSKIHKNEDRKEPLLIMSPP